MAPEAMSVHHEACVPRAEAPSLDLIVAAPEARASGHCGAMGHDLTHMCLAVLGGLLLLAWLLVSFVDGVPGQRARSRPSVWRMRPRAAGRSLLTFICVSRT